MLSQLADNPEIEAATARVRVPALIMSERASSGVTLIGVLPDKERRHSRPLQRIIEGRQMTATIEPEVVVGKALVRKLKTAIGKRLVILTEGADQEMKELGVKIVGVFDTPGTATEEGVILLALPLAQSLVDFSSSEVSEIELLTDLDKAELIAAQVQRKFPTLEVLPWQMLVPFIASLYKVQSGFLLLWFTIVGLTALSSLLNTVYMSTIERYREFGMLMAIGMNRSQLLTQVLIEVLFLLLLGIVSANCVALLVVDYFMVGIDLSLFSSALERFGVDTLLFPRIILRDWYLANSLMVVTGLVGGFFPALRAAQLKPIEAMRKV
jgi:ABC-type lipoprotein release transport system permease subunit